MKGLKNHIKVALVMDLAKSEEGKRKYLDALKSFRDSLQVSVFKIQIYYTILLVQV